MGRSITLRQYFNEIDRRYSVIRGVPSACTPRDVSLILEWHERGIPLALILRTLDEVSQKHGLGSTRDTPIRSLTFVRRAVEKGFRSHRILTPLRRQPSETGFGREVLAGALERFGQRLRESSLSDREGTLVASVVERIAKLVDPWPDPVPVGLVERAEKELSAMDEEIARAMIRHFPDEAAAARAQAEEALAKSFASYRDMVSAKAYRSALETRAETVLRKQLGIPKAALAFLGEA